MSPPFPAARLPSFRPLGTVLNPSFITGLSSPYGIFLGPGSGALTPPTNGYYAAGQSLLFTAPFSKVVNVTGTPQIAFTLGSRGDGIRAICLRQRYEQSALQLYRSSRR